MLTNLKIRNFKQFRDVEIELANPVVFIGPNNSGKSTALQALALWELGAKRWLEKRAGKKAPERRPGVTISRRDLVSVPVPDANLLWRDLHVRDATRSQNGSGTQNVRIDVVVDGVTAGSPWSCGLEFDYANDESFYCRPLRKGEGANPERMTVPDQVKDIEMAFLPPMSGLSDREFEMQPGQIRFLIGQGRTAEVLRNLCYQLWRSDPDRKRWLELVAHLRRLFGVSLGDPVHILERSEIRLTYRDARNIELDLSCAGRGMHQVLLLLAFLYVNPKAVLLLDEPDAHLEILRQREIYNLLSNTAREQGGQVVVASHSEVILNEAADRDTVVAFVGRPHRIGKRGSQLRKSLSDIGWDLYEQAKQKGWVLFLEGSTDLSILQSFSRRLNHPAAPHLEQPFVSYIENQPQKGRERFYGLREAEPRLIGFLLCDRLEQPLQPTAELDERMWRRREIENYLCQPETLLAYAGSLDEEAPLIGFRATMEECIKDLFAPAHLRDRSIPWWNDTKASDEILDPVFAEFFRRLGMPNLLVKSSYHQLADHVPPGLISPEITEILDAIAALASRARPVPGSDSDSSVI